MPLQIFSAPENRTSGESKRVVGINPMSLSQTNIDAIGVAHLLNFHANCSKSQK